MKTKRCTINFDGFRKTDTGKRKVWRTDGIPTYCCSFTPAYFVWEKNTKHNGYNGYTGYFNLNNVTFI